MPAVGEDEVLVAIRAAGANPHDWRSMRGDPSLLVRILLGLRKPRRATVLGSDIAGRVETFGMNVTRFRPGDEVFAEVGFGGFAEYVSISQDLLVMKPANVTFAQAAAVPKAGMAALRALGPATQLLKGILLAPFVSQRIAAVTGKANKEDLQVLRELIEARQVTPVIDRTYPLDQAPEAIRYIEEGHARGKVVIAAGDT